MYVRVSSFSSHLILGWVNSCGPGMLRLRRKASADLNAVLGMARFEKHHKGNIPCRTNSSFISKRLSKKHTVLADPCNTLSGEDISKSFVHKTWKLTLNLLQMNTCIRQAPKEACMRKDRFGLKPLPCLDHNLFISYVHISAQCRAEWLHSNK